ncbi:MAG: TonB-dependent receptor [Pseudomonadota bacterium]|nr:TonB-dependent receptor [Pseudomonadota bacterium]
MRQVLSLSLGAALVLGSAWPVSVAARGQESRVHTQAGSASQAAIAIARQTGASVVIVDPALARRAVPALNARIPAAEAVRRLARAAGGRVVATGPAAWRIEPVSRPARTPRAAPQVPEAPREITGAPIIVLSSKRELALGDLPAQVAILEPEELEAGGIGGTEKITRQLPTVASTHLGSGRNKLFIRGIADSSFTGPTQATVGQYLGDMRLTYNAPDPDLRLTDMARVEVLEGPQGTLYGAGSLGGIIRLVPHVPDLDDVAGSAVLGGSLTRHGEPGVDGSAMLNLPLVEGRVGLRASLDAQRTGGYIDKPRIDGRNVNGSDILGGRVALRLEPAPDWSVTLMALGQRTDNADSQYADREGSRLENGARVAERADADYAMGQLVVAGRLGTVRLRSTTGLVRQTLRENFDATPQGGPPRLFTQANRTRMVAHETRLWQPERGGVGWVAGVSFTHNETRLNRSLTSFALRAIPAGVRNVVDEGTVYGEASLRLAAPLVATAGARITHSRLGGGGEDIRPEIQLAHAAMDIAARRSFTTVLPSAALNLTLAPEASLFLRYQEGFRPGGLAIESEYVRRFRDDHTQTFEVGARHGQRGRGAFDFALSLSYTRWQDIQADFIDASGLPSTANIGDGRIWTASVSGGLRLARGLRAEAGISWNRSKVDEPALPLMLLSTRSMQVPNIAHLAARVAMSWDRELGGDIRLKAQGWASYVGRSRLGVGPELGAPQGDYLDTGALLRVGTERLGVSLGITNIADVRGNRFALGTPFGTGREQVTPLRPRTLRIGLDTAF